MMTNQLMNKYAELIIKSGVNLQQQQTLIINVPVVAADFAKVVTKEAYKNGAKEVIVRFYDEYINRLHVEYQELDQLCSFPDYKVDEITVPVKHGACLLHIESSIPDVMQGIDPDKNAKMKMARQLKLREYYDFVMGNKVQWCIVGYPNIEWANKVFPNDDAALEKLASAILSSVHVHEDNDPVAVWKKHTQNLHKHVSLLNEYNFEQLHFKNSLGTDVTIRLVENHVWAGGEEHRPDGVVFNANMPTEEVFTMPHKHGVNGSVVSTKPLDYNGNLIKDFTLVFKDGKVVEYHAKENEASLKALIEFDEGSCYLGEVALVPYASPISLSNILYYNTLFDENASCHLALGRAYPMNIKDADTIAEADMDQIGMNMSMTHNDFMFGSKDMEIVGITKTGEHVQVFKDGNFVI